MNNIYFETNNNEYIVFESDNKVSKVKSNNDIGEILSIENDLEELKNKIESKKNHINYLKILIKYNKLFNKLLPLGSLFLLIVGLLNGVTTISVYILLCVIMPALIKGLLIGILGTNSTNLKEIHKLKLENIVSEAKVDALTIKLKKRREKNNYSKIEYNDFKEVNSLLENNKSKEPTIKKLVLKREP